MTSIPNDPKTFLTGLFRLAVSTADPMQVVAQYLPARPEGPRAGDRCRKGQRPNSQGGRSRMGTLRRSGYYPQRL